MSRTLIQNGRIIDPASGTDRVGSLLMDGRKIAGFDVPPADDMHCIDATGLIVAPGLIDLNTQLREPGHEEDETIAAGAAAAIAGGFTTIACLPNTDPPIDTPAGVEFVRQKASKAELCNVYVLGCVSKNREGQELAEIGALCDVGAVAFTDAPRSLMRTELLYRALQYCLMFDTPIFNHPEMLDLSHDGVMHEGLVSLVLGLGAMPAEAEDLMTARDLRLAESTGGRLHLMNVSTAGSVELLTRAKGRGVSATAAICPQHFTLTDERMRAFDTSCKVNPPLRSQEHLEACIDGLKTGAIDAICSGHSPRAAEKKMLQFDDAPFGMTSLETTLSLVIRQLIEPGHLSWLEALACLTIKPAQILKLNKGTLAEGADADITLIDPQARWEVSRQTLRSQSCNTPFMGDTMHGKVTSVFVLGKERLAK